MNSDSAPSRLFAGDTPASQKRLTDHGLEKALGITEKVCKLGSIDSYIRPSQLEKVIAYVLNNLIRVGLVKHWRDWAQTFLGVGCKGLSHFSALPAGCICKANGSRAVLAKAVYQVSGFRAVLDRRICKAVRH